MVVPIPRLGPVDLRDREDEVRGRLDGALHEPAGRARVFLGHRVDELAQAADAALDHAVERVDRLAARHLSGGVAAHAVGDDVEAELVVHEERVFVHGALAPQIGQRVSGAPEGRRRGHGIERRNGSDARRTGGRAPRGTRRLGRGSAVVARRHRGVRLSTIACTRAPRAPDLFAPAEAARVRPMPRRALAAPHGPHMRPRIRPHIGHHRRALRYPFARDENDPARPRGAHRR